jgi:Trk K+ transport system NAD-binding subunit
MEQHVILCGLGRVGRRVLEYLRAAGVQVVVIDNRCSPDDPQLGGAKLLQGDCRRPEVLEQAGLPGARGLLILTSDDLISLSTALAAHRLSPQTRLVVRMFNQGLLARLGKNWNLAPLSTSALAAPLMALIARTGEALGSFCLEDGTRQQVAEVTVRAGSALAGLSAGEVAEHGRCVLLAHTPRGQPARLLQEIDPAARLAVGDRLAVCGPPEGVGRLCGGLDEEARPELLWAGHLRRHWRVLARTLAEIDLPVKICTSVLLAVIVASTLIFHLSMHYDTIQDALYRTISLMATAGDMRGREIEPGGWQKVFVSALRIMGAALTAAFTAILTNYLVRAQLRGALEVRRIPESGHVIVCGLGNVGFRVVEALLRQGERVVVLERSRDNPFILTARRRGAAVIVGDATMTEVLRQAHAGAAGAVVAVTNHELINLEVGLLARELSPAQRVVMRLTDPGLAQTLRESADIRLAVSVPELAAPAFVAALFGDTVRGVFLVEGRLLAAVDLLVAGQDGVLEGQTVRALAVDYHLQPVALAGADGTPRPDLLRARLRADDRLTAIIGLGDLQRLLRREPPPANFLVEVTACPPPARPFVAQLLRTTRGLGAEAADKAAEQLPLCLQSGLTRGQAEDLLCLLARERVSAELRAPGEQGKSVT